MLLSSSAALVTSVERSLPSSSRLNESDLEIARRLVNRIAVKPKIRETTPSVPKGDDDSASNTSKAGFGTAVVTGDVEEGVSVGILLFSVAVCELPLISGVVADDGCCAGGAGAWPLEGGGDNVAALVSIATGTFVCEGANS